MAMVKSLLRFVFRNNLQFSNFVVFTYCLFIRKHRIWVLKGINLTTMILIFLIKSSEKGNSVFHGMIEIMKHIQ